MNDQKHIHVAAALLLSVACGAMPSPAAVPTITTGPLSWKIEQEEYSFRARGKAPIEISDTTHAYLLTYRVLWANKIHPDSGADTTVTTALLVPGVEGSRFVEIGDYEGRCTTYSTRDCIRTARDPVARIELVGWARLERP